MKFITALLSLGLLCTATQAQTPKPRVGKGQKKAAVKLTTATVACREVVYKTTPQGELKLHFYSPTDGPTTGRPCVVFFFGGGWKSGSYLQFVPQAEYLATRGVVAACADYRILNVHKTTPDKAVEDAKSAMRWVRGNAAELGISPDKIVAAGGSAGGHLAACTALCKAYDCPQDDLSISPKPNAMVLFNPAMNIATLFRERKADQSGLAMAEAITPNSFVAKDTPPAILFFGGADALKVGGDEYVKLARDLGLRAEMWVAPDLPHGFFNREPWTQVTARQMDVFLASLGLVSGEPTVKMPEGAPSLVKE